MSTRHPWKLFRNGSEIVFPLGARRRIQATVVPIPNAGGIERTLDGTAVWTGSSAFKRHAITLSCTDMTAAPIANLWPGDLVTLHSPDEMSVPGPVATLDYDPVPGTVYGVDANDTPVGSTASGSRSVNIPGAVAIRFRPIMQCVVESKDTRGTQGKADAGWTLALQELSGAETSNDDGDRVSFAAPGLQSFEVGTAEVLELAPLVTTTTGLPVFYGIASGSLPPGMVLNGSTGQISGIPTAAGLYVVVVMAASGTVSAVQTIPFFAEVVAPPEPSIVLDAADLQSFVVGEAYSLALAPLTTITNSADAATYSVVGGALPAGVSLNTSTGLVSGTPTAHGAYAVTVQAALPTGQTAQQTYALYSEAPPDLDGAWAVLSGGVRQNWSDQGIDFQAEDYTTSGVLTVEQAGFVRVILQGGGAGGGNSSTTAGAGGGSAGQHFDRKIWLAAGTYAVQVAASAPATTQGGITSITPIAAPGGPTIQALGGGLGGSSTVATPGGNGGNGGSGGGGAGSTSVPGSAGSAVDVAFGSNGAGGSSHPSTAASRSGGGGGGFSGSGRASTTRGSDGGSGIKLRLWGTLNLNMAGGGGGGAGQGGVEGLGFSGGGRGGTTANGFNATASTGSGGGGAAGGASGTRTGGQGAEGRAIFITEV